MAQFIYPPVTVDTTGLATEAKQDAIIAELVDVNTELDTISSTVATEATQATLATEATAATLATEATAAVIAADTTSLDAKAPALGAAATAASTPVNIASDQTVPVSATSLPLPTGAATEASLAAQAVDIALLQARTAGSLAPVEHDEVVTTYVTVGNGIGEIETVTYKLASTTVKTLTLSYDSSDRLSGVVAS